MQLVAAAKMKKAQDQAIAGRDYADLLNKVLVNLKDNSTRIPPSSRRARRRQGTRLVIPPTRDFAVALNTNLLKVRIRSLNDADFVTSGRSASRLLVGS